MFRKTILKGTNVMIILSILVAIGCSSMAGKTVGASQENHVGKKTVPTLDQGKWDPDTYNAISELIKKYGKYSLNYKEKKKPYVIFDWDNTSIINDTEEALFWFQIDHMKFNLSPEEFKSAILTNVPKGNFSEEYVNKSGELISLEAISKDLVSDYQYIYDHYKELNGIMSLDEIQKTDQFKDFKVKLYFLYEAIGGTYSTDISYPWVLYWFQKCQSVKCSSLQKSRMI